ncbi:MAG: response regulator [Rhodospirillales bacterium]|nr:response regulator [Rhodospirillales bacterium]
MAPSAGRKVYSRNLPALDLSALRIFVLDDNEFAVTLVKRLLTAMRISEMFSCSNPERALAEITHAKPDIVILDLEMPGKHGLDLVHEIRTGRSGVREDMAILVASAYADREQVRKASDAGTNWVLAKPLSFRHLYEGLVRVTLDDRPFVRADGYIGPCRRVHMTPPEQLVVKRRQTDLS